MNGVPRITWLAQLLLFTVSAVAAFGGTGLAVRGGAGQPVALTATSTPTPTPIGTPQLLVPPTTTPPAARPTPTAEPVQPITIAFGGDVHGEPPIAGLLADGGNPFEGVQESLQRADVAVVNLETAVGSSGAPVDKEYTFRADPVLLDRAVESGVDVVNLANNHALDYGREAAQETRRLAQEAGLAPLGFGDSAAEAYAPHTVEVNGQTVAFLGLSRVLPNFGWEAADDRPGMASAYDVTTAAEAVRSAAEQADHVVVTIHWGSERATCADATQVELASAMAAAGADVIVGHHPHVLQGLESIDGTLVAYSIGNFVFYATRAEQQETGVLTVQLGPDGVDGYAWEPARIRGGVPVRTDANADLPAQTVVPTDDDAAGTPDDDSDGGATSSPPSGAGSSGGATGSGDPDASSGDGGTPTTAPQPSASPSSSPTAGPPADPTAQPTTGPTAGPTAGPSTGPSTEPGASPTGQPADGAADGGAGDSAGDGGDGGAGDGGAGDGGAQDEAPPTIPPQQSAAGADAQPGEQPEAQTRSLRRAVPPATDLPPLLLPSTSWSRCAADLVNSVQ